MTLLVDAEVSTEGEPSHSNKEGRPDGNGNHYILNVPGRAQEGRNAMTIAEAAMANLADLTKLGKQINQKSNEVNQIIKDLDMKLFDMNLGVGAWIPDSPLTSVQTTKMQQDSNGEPIGERRYSHDEVLGFGRLGDRYMLLVKEMLYSADASNLTGYEDWRLDTEGAPRPLLQASREVRIESLDKFERLIDALLEEAQRIIKAIDKGRQTVDNL